MSKKIWVSVIAIIVIIIGIVGYTVKGYSQKSNVITLGSVTSDADIWRHLAKSDEAKKLKLKNLLMG